MRKTGIAAICIVTGWFVFIADFVIAQTPATSAGSREAAEVIRLMDLIGEKRGGIESERVTELQAAHTAYRTNLKAIAPKDMFESKAEYHARDAREMSEVELQRVASINHIHRIYDDRLRQEVEPLIRRVEELLTNEDIVPRNAIAFHLETYDAESHLFHGILSIDSPIVPTEALIYLPMKRADARVFWGNRQSHVPRVRVSLDKWELRIELARFGLDDPDSGLTARAYVVPRVPVARPPEGKASVVVAIKESAADLANRIAKGRRFDDVVTPLGYRAEYNRLIREAKSVFVDDAVVQGLQEIEFAIEYDNRYQAVRAVGTAAAGLQAYLNSFVPSEGFKVAAADLANRIAKGRRFDDVVTPLGYRAEYNRLIREAKSVFVDDAVVQGLQEIEFAIEYDNRYQAVRAVGTAAAGLQAYLNSFVPSEGFKVAAADLANRIAKGRRFDDVVTPLGYRAEYNRLIREAKSVFVDDAVVQGLQEIEFAIEYDNRYQAVRAVGTAAAGLQAYLNSFVPSEGFKVAAADLANRIAKGRRFDDVVTPLGYRAEYNRLIREAKSVFVDDAVVQGLQEIEFAIEYDNRYQAASAYADSARSLGSIVANISDVPMALEITKKPSRGQGFDYLPYSGRFTEAVYRFEKKLGRGFSLDAVDENGWTDLHHAAIRNWPGLASALLDAGADPDAPTGGAAYDLTRRGYTPLHLAAYSNALNIAADLVGRGAEVNAENDPTRWTPLHYAAWTNSQAVAELLIGQGADVHAQAGEDWSGWTPLDIAIKYGASEMAELLRRHGAQCSKTC